MNILVKVIPESNCKCLDFYPKMGIGPSTECFHVKDNVYLHISLSAIRCIGFKWPTSQMADGILKFMISHLGLGSNVQLVLVDFKVL